MHQEYGKLERQSSMAADDVSPKSSRLFVTDKVTKQQYLIDTGSDLSVSPRSKIGNRTPAIPYDLFAANGSIIRTFGWKQLSIDLGLGRDFRWRFIIADVTKPIIGADFLHHFNLLVDLNHFQDSRQITRRRQHPAHQISFRKLRNRLA